MSRIINSNQKASHLDRWIVQLIALWRSMQGGSGTKTAGGELRPGEISALVRALRELTRGLDATRALAGAGYMNRPDFAGAYLLYFWPVSYAQIGWALSEAGFTPPPRPWHALDLGCGPGPASFALADLGAASVTCADASPRILDMVKSLAPHTRSRMITHLWDATRSTQLPSGAAPYDCIVAGHLLNELWPQSAGRFELRAALLEKALDLLAPGGTLLVIEPALRGTSRDLLALRDILVARGARVVAPCTTASGCPALLDPQATCHAAIDWQPPALLKAIANAAGPHREALKMAWLAIRKQDGESPSVAERYRVVSEPMLNKAGRVRVLICGPQGRFALSASKADRSSAGLTFLKVKKGDLLQIHAPQERGSAWGIGEQTVVQIVFDEKECSK